MSRKTNAVKRDILFFLDLVGRASPKDIGEAVGWDMSNEARRTTLQKMLARMVHAQLLAKEDHAAYRSTGFHRMHGLDNHTWFEDRIREVLLSVGGTATTKAIYDSIFEPRDLSTDKRDHYHGLLHRTLRQSRWFRQVATGLWELEPFARDPWTLLAGPLPKSV